MRSTILQAAVLAVVAKQAVAVHPTVHLDYATYQGTANSDGVSSWKALRFAAPPLGALRFAAPQDPPNQGFVQANTYPPVCLGTASSGALSSPPSNTSQEDCLFLNVFAPSNATRHSKLAVYFFIQGGGFNTNSNANYNGTGLILSLIHI